MVTSTLKDSDDYTYSFSKGASGSGSTTPDIYIRGNSKGNINNTGNDRVQVVSLDINGEEKFYNHGNLSSGQDSLNLADVNSKDTAINGFYLLPNSKNTVKITPYGISGKKGNEYVEYVGYRHRCQLRHHNDVYRHLQATSEKI